MSPEIVNFLDDCNFSFYDKDKSDIFVLGTIMMEASLLKEIRLYDKKFKKAKLEQIQKLLNEVGALYSPNYTSLLASMMEIHSKLRPGFAEIILKIEK